MYPLPSHTVHLVLQYISPLTDPLPPHLISPLLRQRHHFLQISPSSPVEYLCWPSPDNAKTIALLDRLHPLSDQASYPTCYTSDPESTIAHVQISPSAQGLRMLFHWDDVHGWTYHDLRLMPFPSPSFSTPQESLADDSASGPRLLPDSVDKADHISSGNEDSYWDAYSAAGNDLTFPLYSSCASKLDTSDEEDAYWARYASVQGSADSTIPSPLPINRKLRPADLNRDSPLPLNDSILKVPLDVIHSRPLVSGLGPPSPNTLAHLLSTISPRRDTFSTDDPDALQSPSAYSTDPSPEQTLADSELLTPPLPDDVSVDFPVAVKVNQVPFSSARSRDDAEDKALTDSIKGLYYLWKSGKKGEPVEKDNNVFLQIVQEAIAYE